MSDNQPEKLEQGKSPTEAAQQAEAANLPVSTDSAPADVMICGRYGASPIAWPRSSITCRW